MTGRPTAPKQGNIVATAAFLVLAGWFAAPVLAASDRGPACDQDRDATLDVARHELTLTSHEVSSEQESESVATTIDSVVEDHLLKPRVEAAARKVFAHGEDEAEAESEVGTEDESDDDVAEPRLRPVSDNELVPFRRQMFRKDI